MNGNRDSKPKGSGSAPIDTAASTALALLVLAGIIAVVLGTSASDRVRLPIYSEFLTHVEQGRIDKVTLEPDRNRLTVQPATGANYQVGYPNNTEERLLGDLAAGGVPVEVEAKPSTWGPFVIAALVLVAIFAVIARMIVRRTSRQGSAMSKMAKSGARRADFSSSPRVTFSDVAGLDETVAELREVATLLLRREHVEALGARIPKGVLLYGPPGTGKTLLARAVAGEAGVPFFSISGSDFVEMFVGVGASRVRDLFAQAKRNSPCIVFVDEIDAVGRHRGAGLGGGHDEREQTLNQLLVEMDGFQPNDDVVVIAATNRPDILDPALLRPGRFDRQIVVDRPNRSGRAQILAVHTRGKPLAKKVDLDNLAAQTPGFTGADLANLVNEAALLAARQGERAIGHSHLEEGVMRVVAGPEKKTRVMSERERRVTAFHEMGHAIVAHFLENADAVHKVSLVSRGRELGYTLSLPTEDKFLTTRAELSDTIAVSLGGRAAEEVVFGEVTTRAADDLEKATATAKRMVMRFGMSEKLGPRVFGRNPGQPFLGRVMPRSQAYSKATAREIDSEIGRQLDLAYARARQILGERREELETLSVALLERETIDRDGFVSLLHAAEERESMPALALPC